MADESLYLYCVARANRHGSFGVSGIGERGGAVRAIADGGIAMVVSRAPRVCYADKPPERTLRDLAAHQRVIEQVMGGCTVVPMKFGTFAADEAEVIRILQAGRDDFERALARFDGRIELDVVATWPDLAPVFDEIATEAAVQELMAEVPRAAPDQQFQQRVRLGELVKERLDERRNELAERIVTALRDRTDDVCMNGLKDDSMIVNAALLIWGEAEAGFDAALRELDEQFQGTLNFRCVGPLPPYSFATAEVKAVKPAALDAARRALDLPECASLAQMKDAHRRLARQCHPDHNPGDAAAEARLKEATAAFKLLEEYCGNVKHALAPGQCEALPVVKIRKLSELRAATVAP